MKKVNRPIPLVGIGTIKTKQQPLMPYFQEAARQMLAVKDNGFDALPEWLNEIPPLPVIKCPGCNGGECPCFKEL